MVDACGKAAGGVGIGRGVQIISAACVAVGQGFESGKKALRDGVETVLRNRVAGERRTGNGAQRIVDEVLAGEVTVASELVGDSLDPGVAGLLAQGFVDGNARGQTV